MLTIFDPRRVLALFDFDGVLELTVRSDLEDTDDFASKPAYEWYFTGCVRQAWESHVANVDCGPNCVATYNTSILSLDIEWQETMIPVPRLGAL